MISLPKSGLLTFYTLTGLFFLKPYHFMGFNPAEEHEKLAADAEQLLQNLELPHRKVL
jgi:hypothetical protein